MERLSLKSLGGSFVCGCGEIHRLPIEYCHIGLDAAERLAAVALERCGRRVLVLADENTRRAAGERLHEALGRSGKRVFEHTYGADPLDATDEEAQAVARVARRVEADFITAVGSGTVCDLAKAAGDTLSIPVLLYPTAASMNGYTSGIVALKVKGLKRTLPCQPALGIFSDPEVAATAPVRMTAAGVADFLSKCSSSADWRASHLLRGGYYCARPREFFEGTQERLLEAAPRVPSGDIDAIATVLDALMLSGLSMLVAGSSAPASGGEHLISHYLDMKSALRHTPHDLHGAQVGVATVHTLRLWERICALEPSTLDIEACVAAQPSEQEIEQTIMADWGPVVGAEVLGQWRDKALTPDALRAELKTLTARLPELREAVAEDLLPSKTVADAIRAAGGPVDAQGLEVPREEYENALRRARYLRNRFTVLDLAAEAGLA